MSKKRLSQEERRTQIIEVAIDLFASKGFKGATTRAIADAAGVSEAIIFRHFATKEDLYDAIITHTVEKRLSLWEQDKVLLEGSGDLRTLLRNFAHDYIQCNRQDTTFIRLMMYSALEDHKFREKFIEIYRSPHLRAIHRAIDRGIRQGIYRPVDPRLTTRYLLWILLHYCINRFIAKTRTITSFSDSDMVENLVTVFVNGLEIPPEKKE